jgi:hypothetical protein
VIDEDDLPQLLLTLFLILVLTFWHTGCTHPAKPLNIQIPVNCIKQVELLNCDATVNPPKCKGSKIRYAPADCAVIEAK